MLVGDAAASSGECLVCMIILLVSGTTESSGGYLGFMSSLLANTVLADYDEEMGCLIRLHVYTGALACSYERVRCLTKVHESGAPASTGG